MAISLRSQGTTPSAAVTPITGTTSVTPALPSGITNGDIVLIYVANKADTVTPTTPASWTLAGSVAGGTAGTAVDASPLRVTVFYRVKDASWSTMPAITITGGTAAMAQAFCYQTSVSGSGWNVAASGGADSTSGAAFSVTAAADPGIQANDHCVVFIGAEGDAPTWSAHNITATGVVFNVDLELSEPKTTQGNDMGGCVYHTAVTAGTSSGAPLIQATGSVSSVASTGPALLVRLRETLVQKAASDTGSVAIADKPAFDLRARHTGMWHCAHRGAPWMAPEETLEAYARAYADPNVDVLEMDVRISADGTLWCSHDANTSRLGTTTVTIATATDAQIAAVDMNNAVLPPGWTGTYKFAKLTDVLALYADKILISIEPKTQASGDALTAVLNQYFKYKTNVVLPSFDDAYTNSPVAAGYKRAVRDGSPATAASILAKNAVQTNVQLSDAPASWIAEMQAGGVEVWVWTINTQNQYNTAVTRNAHAVISDDPGYVSGTKRQTGDPYDTQKAFHGYVPLGTTTPVSTNGLFTSPDEWGIDNDDGVTSGVESAVLQGWANPINGSASAPAYYTIDFQAKMISVRAGISNITIGIATNDLEHFAGGATGNAAWQGYSIFQRRNGNNHIRLNDGLGADPALTSVTAQTNLTLDTWYDYRLVVTPTDITFTNLTTGISSTTNDVTYTHGNYIWFGAAGSDSRYRNVVITDNTPVVTPKAASDTSSVSVSDTASIAITAGKSASDTSSVATSEAVTTQASRTITDTSSVAASDTASVHVSGTITDTGSMAAADTAAIQASRTITDTSSVAIADVASISGTSAATDTGAVAISDVATIAIQDNKAASDTGSVSIAETVHTHKNPAVTDTGGMSVSDVAAIVITSDVKSASDTSSIAVADTSHTHKTIPATDTSSVSVTDISDVVIASDEKASSDSLGIGLTESVHTTKTIPVTDTGSVSVADVASVVITYSEKSASDTSGVSVADVSTVAGSASRTDTGAVAVSDSAQVAAEITAADSGGVAVSETNSFAPVAFSASDTLTVLIVDIGSNGAEEDEVVKSSTDTGAVSLIDSGGLTRREFSVSDTSSVAISDTSQTDKFIGATDTGSVAVGDSAVMYKTVPVTDTSSVSVSDVAEISVGSTDKSAADTSAITITESAVIDKQFTRTDTSSVTVTESRSIASSMTRQDSSGVMIADSAHIFVARSASDTGGISAADTASVEVTGELAKSASDSGAVAAADSSSLDITTHVTKSASDTGSVSVSDSSAKATFDNINKTASDTGAVAVSDISSILVRTPPRGRVSFDSRWAYAIMLNRTQNMSGFLMMSSLQSGGTSQSTSTETGVETNKKGNTQIE